MRRLGRKKGELRVNYELKITDYDFILTPGPSPFGEGRNMRE
jgi:hypothetical protein